jgi:hypothetical protein
LEAFLKEKPSIISAISSLRIKNGASGPPEDIIEGCISFLCGLFVRKVLKPQTHTVFDALVQATEN